MGKYAPYDLYIAPLVRDLPLLLPFVCMWFIIQAVCGIVLPRVCPPLRKLNRAQQSDIIVRCVSIANGLFMANSAYIFVREFTKNGYTLPSDLYTNIPDYRPFRVMIVSYFVWDVIVSIYYQWEMMWVIHGVASVLGTYFLSFPFSDHYACYYTGMFELSNAPLHLSTVFATLNIGTTTIVPLLQYIFAFLFLMIRVVGGSYVTFTWLSTVGSLLVRNYMEGGTLVHGEIPIIVSCALVSTIMILQYMWFGDIVKVALGYSKVPVAGDAVNTDAPAKGNRVDSPSNESARRGATAESPKRKAKKEA